MKRYLKSFIPDFRPNTNPISFDLRDFDDKDFCPFDYGEAGVYIISTTDGTQYTYPNGKKNPIVYIGQSNNILRRLRDEHYYKGLKRLLCDKDYGLEDNIQLASRYQYMYYNGSKVDVYKCRGNQDAKDLESWLLNCFYQKYRSLPVGNGARSYGKD